jgi:hypothetical protein
VKEAEVMEEIEEQIKGDNPEIIKKRWKRERIKKHMAGE